MSTSPTSSRARSPTREARYPATTFALDLPDAPVVIRGWEPGLRLLVANLVTNAAHHGRPGGNVWVTLAGPPVLTVDDDGDGIPKGDRERIFEPFRRLEAAADRPGSGLGLALVAQQAREHAATRERGRVARRRRPRRRRLPAAQRALTLAGPRKSPVGQHRGLRASTWRAGARRTRECRGPPRRRLADGNRTTTAVRESHRIPPQESAMFPTGPIIDQLTRDRLREAENARLARSVTTREEPRKPRRRGIRALATRIAAMATLR